jgi:hypothetical protein
MLLNEGEHGNGHLLGAAHSQADDLKCAAA